MHSSVKNTGIKRLALLGIFTAGALLSFLLESLIPPLFIPGAKFGISNVFTLFCMVVLSPAEAAVLLIARIFLGNLIVGNLFATVFSLPAGLVALLVGALLLALIPKISLTAVSVAMAVMHNAVQNVVFCLISGSFAAAIYLPYLLLLGVISGFFVGCLVYLLVHKIPLNVYSTFLNEKKAVNGGNFENSER